MSGHRSSLSAALGVTRLAHLTGLDRVGWPVACAIRPRGHVLQVANGKGATAELAARAALGEAAELWAAERLVPEELVFGTPAGMRARHGEAVWTEELGSAGVAQDPSLWTEKSFVGFRAGRELRTNARIFVPAAALHCPPPGPVPLGPGSWRWTSNGMGAHPSAGRALGHALLEAIERDGLAAALPGGWTEAAIRARALLPATLPRAVVRWQRAMDARGFALWLFDLTPRGGVGLPLAGALLFDLERGPVPLAAGYACRPTARDALLAALGEAAQSRLTDIHGAREDVAPMAAADVDRLFAAVHRLRPRRSAAGFPRPSPASVPAFVRRLTRAGHARIAAFSLAPRGFPLQVVKVVVPTLRVSELL